MVGNWWGFPVGFPSALLQLSLPVSLLGQCLMIVMMFSRPLFLSVCSAGVDQERHGTQQQYIYHVALLWLGGSAAGCTLATEICSPPLVMDWRGHSIFVNVKRLWDYGSMYLTDDEVSEWMSLQL